ncbi:MAG: competence protein CoiA family protein [Chloroflexota bacterium]|nr:MAG: hypothetical protein DIU68_01260 [Chloroflexota bacterium]
MPLRALIDGVEIIAPLLDDAAWEALRRRVADERLPVVLPCCDVEGYLRRSKSGTRHFAHKQKSNCFAKGETLEHLRAKAEIVLACREAGYSASTEVAADNWRADVLATRGNVRIAFEVQWSFLRLDEALRRQRRYSRDSVRGCWFFRRPPKPLQRDGSGAGLLEARHDLPLFHLFASADDSFLVALNEQVYPLRDFVVALLRGEVRFCAMARANTADTLRATFFELACPRCARRCHAYYVDPTQVAGCGLRFQPDSDWYSTDFAFHPALLAAFERYQTSGSGARLHLCGLQRDSSGQVVAFACPYCRAVFDRGVMEMALYGARRFWDDPFAEAFEAVIQRKTALQGAAPHWCYPADGRFCCNNP